MKLNEGEYTTEQLRKLIQTEEARVLAESKIIRPGDFLTHTHLYKGRGYLVLDKEQLRKAQRNCDSFGTGELVACFSDWKYDHTGWISDPDALQKSNLCVAW